MTPAWDGKSLQRSQRKKSTVSAGNTTEKAWSLRIRTFAFLFTIFFSFFFKLFFLTLSAFCFASFFIFLFPIFQDLAIMTLESHTGVRGFVKTKVKIESPQATQMKSLVHAYFVRYVLPKRAKEAEEKTGQVQPFTAGGG